MRIKRNFPHIKYLVAQVVKQIFQGYFSHEQPLVRKRTWCSFFFQKKYINLEKSKEIDFPTWRATMAKSNERSYTCDGLPWMPEVPLLVQPETWNANKWPLVAGHNSSERNNLASPSQAKDGSCSLNHDMYRNAAI